MIRRCDDKRRLGWPHRLSPCPCKLISNTSAAASTGPERIANTAAQLVLAFQTLVSRETDPMASAVISVTNLAAGSGH